MSVLTNETAAATSVDESQFEALYAAQFDFLSGVAIRKFRVPPSEAETLVHEVFLTYLKRADEIRDINSWLLGAICHASRYYWRANGRDTVPEEPFERIDPASLNILDSLPNQLAAREALECLAPRCQEVLRLRFFDGCSIAEIAQRLGLKTKYTQKLVSKCLRRAERMYAAKEQRKGKR
jgi:RNA polymerase sigma factor (sigma-70 family)